MHNTITVTPFQSHWAHDFEKERESLQATFESFPISFYHIGSTSIPHCDAKPIIDILGVTPDVTKIDIYNATLAALGYEALGEYGLKQRRFFHKRKEPSVNLHIFEESDPEVERHLRFCHYLREHPDEMRAYCELKKRLASQWAEDRTQYVLGKEKFIKNIDMQAAHSASQRLFKEKPTPKKKEWSQEEILKAMEVNLHLQMTYFAKYVPSLEVVFQPDVTIVRSTISDDTFNIVLAAKFTESNAQQRVKEVLNFYSSPKRPFSWWLSPLDAPSDLQMVLVSQGLRPKEENVGMYLLIPDQPASPSPLTFQRVSTKEQLKQFSEVIIAIGGNKAAYETLYSELPPIVYQNTACFEMHVGYKEGKPIVTGILVLHANVAGIYYVATLPEERKKGFGTAMMEHLIAIAKSKGYFLSILQASPAGKHLYERLGFKECCVYHEFGL